MNLSVRITFIAVLFSATAFAQTGTRLVDFNAKTIGRGGTSIGTFDSPELMMTNPAGISFLSGSMIDLDVSAMFPSLHFQNTINDKNGKNNVFPLPSLAYINKYKDSDFTWGAGVFTYGGMGADFNLNHALFVDQNGNYVQQEYHSKLATMEAGLSSAYKINNNLSIGVTLQLVYSTLEFWMPYSLNPMIMKGTAMPGMTFGQMFAAPQSAGGFGYSEVTAYASMKDLTAFGFNGKIGVAYKVNDRLSFGLSYTMPTSLTYKNGKAGMDMTAQFNDAFGKAVMGYMYAHPGTTQQAAQAATMQQFSQMGIDLSKGMAANYDLNVELKFPQTVGFGLSYKTGDNLMLAADVEWMNWANAFDKMTLHLSNGTNSNINLMMGNNGTFSLDFPMNWKNTLLLKLGAEYQLNPALALRIGYAYGSNPVPDETVFPVFPAIVENHIMVGAGYVFGGHVEANIAYEAALNNSQTASNPSLIAAEYNGSVSQLSTNLVHLDISYKF